MTAELKGFVPGLPAQPRIWDPTRLALAATCWRKHWLVTVRGLRRNGAPSVHLQWGQDYHKCVETYDACILDEDELAVARDKALRMAQQFASEHEWGEAIETWRCTDPELVPAKRLKNEDGSPKMILNRDRCHYAKGYGQVVLEDGPVPHCPSCGGPVEFSSVFFPWHPKKTGETLVAAVRAYCNSTLSLQPYQFPDGCERGELCWCWGRPKLKCEHWKVGAKGLEFQARLPLPIAPFTRFGPLCMENCGHCSPPCQNREAYEILVNIDSLVEWEEEITIRERKTTGLHIESPKVAWKFWLQFDPNIQIDTYDLVGSVLWISEIGRPPKILVEVLCIADPENPFVERRVIHIPESRRQEWFRELQGLILDAEKRAVDVSCGVNPEVAFPRNTTACQTKFGICPFWELCTAAPAEREALIAEHYHVERWSPEDAESYIEEEE